MFPGCSLCGVSTILAIDYPSQRSSMGSFWWCDILKLLSQFKDIVVISIRDGATSILWHDHWGGNILSQHFPELYSFSYAAISIPLP